MPKEARMIYETCFQNFCTPINNNAPIAAGIIKFTNHTEQVAINIPTLFIVKNPSTQTLTNPRTPNSATAKLGAIDSTKKVKQMLAIQSNGFNKIIKAASAAPYWNKKIKYRISDSPNKRKS
jgi:hypothetical protein